ncbi:EAL domain-containing protein [Massilia sp. IC2-477]|uniref:putative bifunctional diguanylate cyclase/phosphodiesterase n=1 Tax=Massilia sp. IC2-477 TaxID=2887198 RepID=UPI001D1080F2|nr:GGDEF domain-containing phosphodiesterase [Massilia sp. IC2-477]MCC2954345.1 EAL domain-containing protein [Massilia sp. IC2-477]
MAHLTDILVVSQEITGLGCTIVNLEDGQVSWSVQQYRNFGVLANAVEPTLEALIERVHPGDRQRLRDAIDQCILLGQCFALDLRVQWLDETWHILRTCGRRVAGESFERTWFACATVDVTEQRHLHDQLLLARCDLEHAQEIAHLGTWAIDLESGLVQTTSAETYRIFRMQPGSEPARIDDLNRRIHPNDLGRVLATRSNVVKHPAERYDCEYRLLHEDGEIRYVHSMADVVTDSSGQPSRMIGMIQDVTEIRRAREEIHRLAFFDDTTGLPNRVAMHHRLLELFSEAEELPIAVVTIELSQFREINFTLGHVNGDDLLRNVAQRLGQLLGGRAHLSRSGNAQFTAVLHGELADGAARICEQVAIAFETTFKIGGIDYDVNAHVGTAIAPLHAKDAVDMVRKADVAVFQARRRGQRCMVYSANDDPYDPERLALLGQFRQAIVDGQIELYCQPKVSMITGTLLGVEALVRWNHPERGMVPPSDFVPLIESSELIHALTKHMLQESVRQAHEWHSEGLDIPIAVNLSTRNLNGRSIASDLQAMLERCGGTPDWIGLEITESSLILDLEASIAELNTLSSIGFQLYIDDFGTGYSSLNYLTRLPVNVIKIDHGFTANMLTDPRAATIVKATIDMAHELGLSVVAEGTANQDIWNALVEYGCDVAQGFYVAPPFPARELSHWVRSKQFSVF